MYPYWRDDIADKIELIFGAGRTTKILTPLFIFLPFYILMIPAVIAGRRNWRRKCWKTFGRCEECGYDLRASKERCPECGTEFESSDF